MNKSRFDELLQKFPALHLLVVGDIFLDKYLDIDPALSETSLETGLEAYQVVRIRHSPGAGGTVVANLRAMDVPVSVVSVIGRDGAGFDLRQDLARLGVDMAGLLETPDRFTPTYTKPLVHPPEGGPPRELNRLDIKNRRPLPAELETAVLAQVERLLPAVSGVVIADQVPERNCGVITDRVRAGLSRLAAQYPAKPFLVDSRTRIGEFAGVMLKPNIHEARAAVAGQSQPDDIAAGDLLAAARRYGSALYERNRQAVFVTLGEQGILA
ncbi:MAG: carbohydrate kinase, partial [Chloroflexi bacterium]